MRSQLPVASGRRRSRTLRLRRGSELIEFSLVFPMYLFVFFGVIEYSWYFFQRQGANEAARVGCQIVAQLDPDTPEATKEATAVSAIEAELRRQAGIECGGLNTCFVQFTDRSQPPNNPPRVQCEVTADFVSLTGFLGSNADIGGPGGDIAVDSWGARSGTRLIPPSMTGRSVAVFQEAD